LTQRGFDLYWDRPISRVRSRRAEQVVLADALSYPLMLS
jgi:hypothetical protein